MKQLFNTAKQTTMSQSNLWAHVFGRVNSIPGDAGSFEGWDG
jgi:hypothetical protein